MATDKKYHIGRDGTPKVCRAKGICKLGKHFDNKEEAQKYADGLNEKKVKKEYVFSKEQKEEIRNKLKNPDWVARLTQEQAMEIVKGSKSKVNFLVYAETNLSSEKMRIIRKVLEDGYDYKKEYANPNFTVAQIKEIAYGERNNLNVSLYAKEDLTKNQMSQIKRGLKQGVDASLYAEKDLSPSQMRKIRKKLVEEKQNKENNIEQKNESDKQDFIKKIKDPNWIKQFDGMQIQEITEGLKSKIDVSVYANPKLDWEKMSEIRFSLTFGHNYKKEYADPNFNLSQIKEIQKGLKSKVNVDVYADSTLTTQQMRNLIEKLISRKNKKESGE